MALDLNAQTSHDQGIKLSISVDTVLFLMLVVLIFCIRITNLNYNTLFVDEAIYATVGRNVLSGVFNQNATTWMYGSYLYPVLAATANYALGEVGLRGLSAVLSTIAAVFVFFTSARLFNQQSGLWAMLIFGLTAISIDIGQYAVYDAPVVPLLAIALYCLIRAASATEVNENLCLLTAAVSFALATLSKYFAILYLPALVLIALAAYLFHRRSIYGLFSKFLGPVVLLLGIYAFSYGYDLLILFKGNFGIQTGDRWLIVQDVWAELGSAMLLALLGAGWWLWARFFGNSGGRAKRELVLWVLLIPFVALFILAAPLYHLVAANLHVAWKHTLYSLIFLAPLAGHGCAVVIAYVRSYQGRWAMAYRIVGALVTGLSAIWFVNHALDRNWGFQHTWPNVAEVVEYLQAQGLTKDQHVLAEGAQIYEYYFDLGPTHRTVWQDTWYMEYGDQQGTEAMSAAIRDHWFNFVVLDDYYTPGLRQKLAPALRQAGYSIGYEKSQSLSTGETILMQVYILPN